MLSALSQRYILQRSVTEMGQTERDIIAKENLEPPSAPLQDLFNYTFCSRSAGYREMLKLQKNKFKCQNYH